jgi:hypothetical protein
MNRRLLEMKLTTGFELSNLGLNNELRQMTLVECSALSVI